MSNAIIQRGPDSSGIWCEVEKKIAFGHRRLAILDLSEAGQQPMISETRRYVITYNGEIYNSEEIKKQLASEKVVPVWRGYSDTEVLLAGFDAWGIKETLLRVTGMFAIAVWDSRLNELTLTRDRMGEKPLYYGWQGEGKARVFLFGSELKALKKHPQFKYQIDRDSLGLFLQYNYVPAPHSIYCGIKKLRPGVTLKVSGDGKTLLEEKYWDTLEVTREGSKKSFVGDVDKITNKLEIVLDKAISQQMMADVPLGAFLSGGIDSSTIVSMMVSNSSQPVKTFTIGFNEVGYNEAEHAKAIAKHLRTEHTELYVSAEQSLDVIPNLPKYFCEPFADSSQIPTFLVSSLARKDVTVCLSGDGGDELFCGYNRYIFTEKLWRSMDTTPALLRKGLSRSLEAIPSEWWDKSSHLLNRITGDSFNAQMLSDKIQKGVKVVDSESIGELYWRLTSNWWNSSEVVLNSEHDISKLSANFDNMSNLNSIQKMMTADLVTYLPDDILTKVDRAAMAVSLETRVPFLDHNVVEFASRIPQSMKLRDGVGKWILREVLHRRIPKNLIDRPKQGFGVPIGSWLRGPLRDWAEDLLDETRLNAEGFFSSSIVRKMWNEHLRGTRNWQSQLWAILMFQAWLEENI